jgi:pimeloyl-ACP methyl ester carboxylesterase
MKLPGGLPTFLYNPGDYTPEQFRDVLAGGVMNRAPARLLREVISMGIPARQNRGHLILRRGDRVLDVTAAVGAMDVPVLAFASEEDQLVTRAEAHGLADRPGVEKVLVPPCGHGGYFFKPATRAAVFAESRRFLEAVLR